MKIVFFANTDWFLYNFNREFGLELKSKGFEVVFVSPSGNYSSKILDLGLNWIEIPLDRTSIRVIDQIKSVIWLIKFFKKEKPDILHNFTLKCVILGGLAGQIYGMKRIINELTGLGHVFTSINIKTFLLRNFVNFLIQISLISKSSKLLLLNEHDFKYFSGLSLIRNKALILIYGVGVDCDFFYPIFRNSSSPFRVLLPSRILWDKGVSEFVSASKILNGKGKNIEFILAGDIDFGNPTAVDAFFLKSWTSQGLIVWLGHVNDIKELYHSVDLVVLPSYREGLPTSLTEAAACGLPLVATNVPGCIDVVENFVNGIIVPPKSDVELADAIELLSDNPDLCRKFGILSREKAISKFSKDIIFLKRFELYV